MSEQLTRTLQRLEIDRMVGKLRRGWPEMPPWVFRTEAGTPLDESRGRKAFAQALKRAKLPAFRLCTPLGRGASDRLAVVLTLDAQPILFQSLYWPWPVPEGARDPARHQDHLDHGLRRCSGSSRARPVRRPRHHARYLQLALEGPGSGAAPHRPIRLARSLVREAGMRPERLHQGVVMAPPALEREGINDRAVDLWSPLLAIAYAADAEDTGNRRRDIREVAKALATARDADAESGTTARLVDALYAIRERKGDTVSPPDLLEALRALPGWD